MTNHVVCLSVVLFSSSTLCHASAFIFSIVSDLCVHGETLYIYLVTILKPLRLGYTEAQYVTVGHKNKTGGKVNYYAAGC